MKLFQISKNDVIRTQNALWNWDDEDGCFYMDDNTNSYDKSSINAIYISGKYSDKRAVSAGDLIEVKDSDGWQSKVFTIIDIDVIDITELFDIAHKASINISNYISYIDGDVPYKKFDLTGIPARKEK